jgi:two-component system CheB/CheR fusion protein
MSSSKNKRRKISQAKQQPVVNKLFPIAAIGASAGGLEAYTSLLNNLADDTGMAFVMIMHLDPKRKSMLKEILSRETSMKVITAENNISPKPNTVYVIAQNQILKIEEGIFKTYPRPINEKNMPIDIFMRSLAEDETHYSIGVVLSGTDSDGVMGLEAIKSHGGITFAQDSKTAKFNDMPRNAINWGAVDFILPPPAIARELGRISKNKYLDISRHNSPEEVIPDGNNELSVIFNMLQANNGIDFKDYKPTTVKRRILRRMVMHKIPSIKSYVTYLRKHPAEMDELCEDILINVTSFFRDPDMYAAIKEKVLPDIMKKKDRNTPARIWVCGCSTGEEAYSMAIVVTEYLEDNHLRIPVQIFSTDLSESGIEKARMGIYPQDIKNEVSSDRLKKYFVKTDGRYQVNKMIREMCVFAKQNLIQDPPFSRIDLISCRNVLIYLGRVLQNKVIPIFHYAASDSGYLVLGSSDSIGTFTELFETVDKKNKIYRKKNLPVKFNLDFAGAKYYAQVYSPGGNALYLTLKDGKKRLPSVVNTDDYKKRADIIMLNAFAPASVIVNSDLQIVQFRGKTDNYLDFPQGEPTFNLLRIAKDDLPLEIRSMVKQAARQKLQVRKDNIEITGNASSRIINLIVNPINPVEKKNEQLYLVIFEEVSLKNNPTIDLKTAKTHSSDDKKLSLLKSELSVTKDNLQSIIEQLESANEELLSANEEIQSGNEELQSTNEELETAKEELQSTNEELTTVNDELSKRNIEISGVNNDLTNLLRSINIPIVMVDNNLKIRRYTNVAERLLNLIPADIGRKITAINSNVEVPNLEKLIQEVIQTPTIKELHVKDNEGCWYSMRIRPYLTLDNKIDGVIIAFIDVTMLQESLMEIEIKKSEIEKLNSSLEERVKERTKELNSANVNMGIEIKERKTAEESLRLLSKHLVNAQETERQRLSRELHDGVNQLLSIVKRKMLSASSSLKKQSPKPVIKDLIDAEKLLDNAIEEVRKVSRNLRPAAIDDLGLASAVKIMVEEFSDRTGIKTKLDIKGARKRMLPETELHIYRIIQEALHNIERHSRAKTVSVNIIQKNSNLNISVKDNGKGFKLRKETEKKLKDRFGLIGMKERAESLGGTLTVISVVSKGTEIKVALPVI